MQRFKNILLVLNPETEWAATLDKAVSLARQNNGRLTLFSVLKEPPGTRGYSEPVAQQQLTAAAAEREEWLRGLMLPFREDNIDVVNQVVEGIPFLEIIHQVLREQHDLVITTAEEKKGIRARLFGTTTMHLMGNVPVRCGWSSSLNHILILVFWLQLIHRITTPSAMPSTH